MNLFNWLAQNTATVGGGSIVLGAARDGYRLISDALSDGDKIEYWVRDGNNREHGIGTYTAADTSIARTTVLETIDAGVYDNTNPSALILSGAAYVYVTANGLEAERSRGVKIAVLSDSLGAVAPHTIPSWPERLETILNALGAQVTVKNFSINQHTFFQARTQTLYGTLTAVDAAIEWVPDVVIVSYGWNDGIVGADSRTVAQIKTDAEDVFDELNDALPHALLIFAEHMPYDNVNFTASTSIKNKGLPPAYMEKPTAGIYANTWTDTMLETVVSSGLSDLFADYDDIIDHIKTNITEVDASISLHYFYVARLGCCASDGLHMTELGSQLLASWVLKELQTISAFTDLVSPIVDQQIELWKDPDTLFSDYLTDSGDGFTLAYPGGPSYEQVPTQWSRYKDLNPQFWYHPYKGSVHQHPKTLGNSSTTLSALGIMMCNDCPPDETAFISVDGGSWIGLSEFLTDNNGNGIYKFTLGGLSLSNGAHTVRWLIGDQVYPEIDITMVAP